jgi:hypothetical protein
MQRLLFNFALIVGLVLSSIATAAERKPPPSQAALNAIRDRGRLLAFMDRAAWVCTDRVQERHKGSLGEGGAFIVYVDNGVYKVAFGVGNEGGGTFLTKFEGIYNLQSAGCDVESFDPPRQDTGWLPEAYTALRRAGSIFERDPQAEAYNHAIVRESADEISIYFYPGTTGNDLVLGADAKISVRGENTEVTRYHKALIKQSVPENKDQQLKASFHTHILDNAPNPLDVLYVMNRRTKVPEYIAGEMWVFYIAPNGEVEFAAYTDQLGKNK